MYKEYAKLDAQIKELEEKKKQMRLDIVAHLEEEGIDKEETKFGIFTKVPKTMYKYSEKVEAMIEKVKLAKIREEEKGLAQASTTYYLLFTAPKN